MYMVDMGRIMELSGDEGRHPAPRCGGMARHHWRVPATGVGSDTVCAAGGGWRAATAAHWSIADFLGVRASVFHVGHADVCVRLGKDMPRCLCCAA